MMNFEALFSLSVLDRLTCGDLAEFLVGFTVS